MLCELKDFVLQAEDGIRDLVRSRWLGDVYKRQANGSSLDNFSVRLTNTTAFELSTTVWEPLGDLVYEISTWEPSPGGNLHELQSEFFWNGLDNLLVEICHNPSNPLSQSLIHI